MSITDRGADSQPSDPSAKSPYDNMKSVLDFILRTMEDQINRKKLDIDGREVADKLNIDIAEMEDILELFARFYIFFRHFFKGDDQSSQESNKKDKNPQSNKNPQKKIDTGNSSKKLDDNNTNKKSDNNNPIKSDENQNKKSDENPTEYVLDEKTAGNLSDFCLLFKNKDFNPTELMEKFPKLFELWQEIPILFNLKVSNTAEELSDKLRKHKAVGKKPKQLTVGNINFKIEYK
jgi:hypothetical protein